MKNEQKRNFFHDLRSGLEIMTACIVIFALALSVLAGCSRKKVQYQGESRREETAETETGQIGEKEDGKADSNADGKADRRLKESLGITGDTWYESFAGKEMNYNQVTVDTDINVPDADELYAMELEEHYYTGEEKKKILEMFLEPATIQVYPEREWTKEMIDKEIAYYNEVLKRKKEDEKLDEDPDYKPPAHTILVNDTQYFSMDEADIKKEIRRLKQERATAPEQSEISAEVGNYKANAYRGMKDGIPYRLVFFSDPQINLSRWILEPLDFQELSHQGKGTGSAEIWCWSDDTIEESVGEGGTELENYCQLSREEARNQALDIAQKLGIEDACVYSERSALLDGDGGMRSIEGWDFRLLRSVGGAAPEICPLNDYGGDDEPEKILAYSDMKTQKNYPSETLEIMLNEKGYFRVAYGGCMKQKKMTGPVKLLSFDKIQKIFREKIKNYHKNIEAYHWQFKYNSLKLVYLRIQSDADPDSYTMLPVWRISEYEDLLWDGIADENFGYETFCELAMRLRIDTSFYVNAIDGSEVDIRKIGYLATLSCFQFLINDYISCENNYIK